MRNLVKKIRKINMNVAMFVYKNFVKNHEVLSTLIYLTTLTCNLLGSYDSKVCIVIFSACVMGYVTYIIGLSDYCYGEES